MFLSLARCYCRCGPVCCRSSGSRRTATTHAQSDWLKFLRALARALQRELVTGGPPSCRRPAASSKITTPLATTLADEDRPSLTTSATAINTVAVAKPKTDRPLVQFHRDR